MVSRQPQFRSQEKRLDAKTRIAQSHYGLLGLDPTASAIEIRQSYRELSKQYHPDTTMLSATEATIKFQRLNEAYATLSNPERRSLYDLKFGFSRHNVIQPLPELQDRKDSGYSHSAYLDPIDRPLSAGEIFVLVILGLTFIGCLLLAIALGLTRGDQGFQLISMFCSYNHLLH